MKIDTYSLSASKREKRSQHFLSTMGVLNVAFAAANIFLWSFVALVVADPIGWATWSSLGSIGHRPDMFEYPYVLLWALPLLGTGMATINDFLGFKRLANVAAVFPLSLFAMTLIMWTFFPEFG